MVESLGEPIESGFPRNSSFNIENSEGEAAMLLPLSGPKSTGRLQIKAVRHGKVPWEFETLVFTPDDRQIEIDLLASIPTETPL